MSTTLRRGEQRSWAQRPPATNGVGPIPQSRFLACSHECPARVSKQRHGSASRSWPTRLDRIRWPHLQMKNPGGLTLKARNKGRNMTGHWVKFTLSADFPLWTMVPVRLHTGMRSPDCHRVTARAMPWRRSSREMGGGIIDDRTTHQSSIGGNSRGGRCRLFALDGRGRGGHAGRSEAAPGSHLRPGSRRP